MKTKQSILRNRALIAMFVVLALVAAACGGDDADDGDAGTTAASGDTTATTAAAAPDTTAAPAPEGGALGTVTVGSGEPIQIRAIQTITGATEALGVDQVRGIELAIADFGPIADHDVALEAEDGLCSAEGGTTAAQKIAADDRVVGVIGTSCSGAGVPASQILSEAGMVLISGSNTSPALTSDFAGNAGTAYQPGYYRTAHNDLIQGRAAATFALEELGAQVAVAIHDGDPYTEGLATVFVDVFNELGGTATITAVNKGDTDMRPVLTEVAAESPDIIFFPIFQPEGDFIIQQKGEITGLENTIMMAADGLLTDAFLELPETQDMYFSGPDLRFGDNAGLTGVGYGDLVATYEAEYGEAPPQVFHAHAYDAAMLLLNAVQQVAVAGDDGSLTIDRQAVRDALTSTSDFPGVTGILSCDEFGDCASGKITIVQNTTPADPAASKANVVYSFEP